MGDVFRHAKRSAARKRDAKKYLRERTMTPPYSGDVRSTYRRIFPSYIDAPHLDPLLDIFEECKTGRTRGCFSYPVRAGKTETLIAGVVDRLLYDPRTRICYLTYASDFAKKKSARMRSLARQYGVPIDPTTRSKQDWGTGVGEGGLWATSVGGQINGMGFDLIVADDLVSGWQMAYSGAEREGAWEILVHDALTRLAPEGSIILNGTRWHPSDPIGKAVELGWPEVNVPALDDRGDSYWPSFWSTPRLHEIREDMGGADGSAWLALYQGTPRSDADSVFRDVHLADEIPVGPRRVVIGVDFAYTTEKSSDYSVAVVMIEVAGVYYVADVLRMRRPEDEFRAAVAKLAEDYSASIVHSYVAATEKPNISLMQRDMIPITGSPAIRSKKVRAMPAAAGWNSGRIKVLRDRSWTRDFIREVVTFSGADKHDDQVDALAAAYDAIHATAPIDWDYLNSVQAAAPSAYPGLAN